MYLTSKKLHLNNFLIQWHINCTSGIGISMFKAWSELVQILLVIICSKHLIMYMELVTCCNLNTIEGCWNEFYFHILFYRHNFFLMDGWIPLPSWATSQTCKKKDTEMCETEWREVAEAIMRDLIFPLHLAKIHLVQ